jgi:hypothetical protein
MDGVVTEFLRRVPSAFILEPAGARDGAGERGTTETAQIQAKEHRVNMRMLMAFCPLVSSAPQLHHGGASPHL